MKIALISDPNTQNGLSAIKCVLDSLGATQKNIGYIASQPDPQRVYFKQTQCIYHELGDKLTCYLELESDFAVEDVEVLFNCDAIHLSGGDTFRFLKWLKHRGLMPLLKQYVAGGGALIGVSAGAMIMTPSVATAYLCGDKNSVNLQELSGLSLVPFYFTPHAKRDNQVSLGLSKEIKRYGLNEAEIYFCDDDSSLAIVAGECFEFGQPLLYEPSHV